MNSFTGKIVTVPMCRLLASKEIEISCLKVSPLSSFGMPNDDSGDIARHAPTVVDGLANERDAHVLILDY